MSETKTGSGANVVTEGEVNELAFMGAVMLVRRLLVRWPELREAFPPTQAPEKTEAPSTKRPVGRPRKTTVTVVAPVVRRRKRRFNTDGLQAEILRFIAKRPMGQATIETISEAFPSEPRTTIRSALAQAIENRRAVRVARGTYRIGPRAPKAVLRARRRAPRRPDAPKRPLSIGKEMMRHVLELFAEFGGADVRAKEVDQHLARHGYSPKSGGPALRGAVQQGLIERVGPGVYRVRTQPDPASQDRREYDDELGAV